MSSSSHSSDLRKTLHLLCGAGAFLLPYLPAWTLLGLLALGAGFSVWVSRRYPQFLLFRPGESAFSGAVTYAIGVSAAICLFPREAAFVGWVALAAGDGAATMAGRRWPLVVIAAGRSLGGALGFLVAGFAAVLAGGCWWRGGCETTMIFDAIAVSLAGAGAELLCRRIDDNLVIPSVCALVFALIQ